MAFTEQQKAEIIASSESNRALARKYGCASSSIARVRPGRWKLMYEGKARATRSEPTYVNNTSERRSKNLRKLELDKRKQLRQELAVINASNVGCFRFRGVRCTCRSEACGECRAAVRVHDFDAVRQQA